MTGLFEGEGCISMHRSPGGRMYPSLALNMTDEDVVRRLQEITGCGSIHVREGKQEGHKRQWCWKVGSIRQVIRLLTAMAPLLASRRRARALEVVEAFLDDIGPERECSRIL